MSFEMLSMTQTQSLEDDREILHHCTTFQITLPSVLAPSPPALTSPSFSSSFPLFLPPHSHQASGHVLHDTGNGVFPPLSSYSSP